MGRTGAYTMLESTDGEYGVPITDPDEFKAFLDSHGLEAIVEWEYEDENAYPRVERQVLYGFCPDRIEDDFKFFIKNVHAKRNRSDAFETFWEDVASFCEPFTCFTAGADNHFPDLGELHHRDGVDSTMFRISGDGDGNIDVTELRYERTEVGE